ncbi:putative 5-formyltetrahydrofolate cyclo-ligase-family protein [Pasteurella multocida]|nr:putative 5-formyltetrahydrofolate cyclo-ligase-family protein [Pasteurella multocida]
MTFEKRRQKLTALEQQQAEQSITQQALQLIAQKKANTVALYLSFDGEVSTQQLITCLWQQGIQVAVPVLHPFLSGAFVVFYAIIQNRLCIGIHLVF